MKHPVGQASNGALIYVNLIRSRASQHIAQQPRLLDYAKDALAKTNVRGPKYTFEHDMGRPIGYNVVVSTSEKDTVFYAQLLHETTFTRFVKHGEPTATQHLSMVLQRDGDGDYELQDIWIGHINPPLPESSDETAESKPFWAEHAFVLENQQLQTRTITKICPY